MVSAVPKPPRRRRRRPSGRWSRGSGRRPPLGPARQRAGVVPSSLVNTRVKLRTLMPTAAASVGTEWSAPGSVRTSSGRDARPPLARGMPSGAANCDCPPGRRRYMTSQRATVCATSAPQSSSTRACEIDARRHTGRGPELAVAAMQRVAVDIDCGVLAARRSLRAQCVQTVRSSSNPAAASANAPVQTLATRRAGTARRRMPARPLHRGRAHIATATRRSATCRWGQHAGQRPVGDDGQAVSPVRTGLGRRDHQAVTRIGPAARAKQLVGAGEDLVRPGQVEGLTAG